MPDPIIIDIQTNLDLSSDLQQLQAMGEKFRELKQEAVETMPNMSNVINGSLEKTATVIDSIEKKMGRLNRGKFDSDSDRARFIHDTEESFKDFNAMKAMQTGNSSFSASLAKTWLAGLPQALQQELDALVPQLNGVIRTKLSTLNTGAGKLSGSTVEGMARSLMHSPELQKMVSNSKHIASNQQAYERFLQHYVANAAPMNRFDEYHMKRYGRDTWGVNGALRANADKGFIDYLPASFRSGVSKHGYVNAFALPDVPDKFTINDKGRQKLQKLFENNPVAVKAALASGVSRRNERGQLETTNDFGYLELIKLRDSMYKEMETRVSGYGKGKINLYDPNVDKQKLASRMMSSSGGKALRALQEIDELSNSEYFGIADMLERRPAYMVQGKEAKRILDAYHTVKYNPFFKNDAPSLDNALSQAITINESRNTHILGGGKWQHNQDVSGAIREISLNGYNKDSKEHRALLESIYKNGHVFDGEKFIAQSTHDTGEDTVIRMISESAMRKAEEQEQAWARSVGFTGSFFKNYTDEAMKAKGSGLTAQMWGKQLDAENKGWTPSHNIGIQLGNKRIALVDFGDEGDGAGYLPSTILTEDIQARFGTAGKGSLFSFNAKNNREFAERTGLLDSEGRWMAKGVDGKEFDISKYDGFIPTSLVKNMMAYEGKSAEEASRMFTEDIKRYGIRSVADYDKENNDSDRLGAQMTTFMQLSPELRQHQTEMAMRRLQELDTEDGMKRYVFANPESDWLSNEIHKNPQLLASDAALARVDAYKTSMLKKMAAGEYIDFGESDSSISNIRAAASPLESFLRSHNGGQLTPQVLANARNILEEAHGRTFSDQEISDLIMLKKDTAIDFQHEGEENIGILRSPTGFGNMVYAKNLASVVRPLYEKYGLSTTGAYVSKDNLDDLQSADFDGDTFKVVTGRIAKSIDDTLTFTREKYPELFDPEKNKVNSKSVVAEGEDLTDETLQRTNNAERRVEAPLGMGFGDGVSMRAAMLDINNPNNRSYFMSARKGQDIYSQANDMHKKGTTYDLGKEDRNVWDTIKLGKEFTKFTSKSNELFNLDPDMVDEEGHVIRGENANKDVFFASNGQVVNLRALRDMETHKINMPSMNVSSHMMALAGNTGAYRLGHQDTTQLDAIHEALESEYFNNFGDTSLPKVIADARRVSNQALVQFATGARTKFTEDEVSGINKMLMDAEMHYKKEAGDHIKGGLVVVDGKEYRSRSDYATAMMNKQGLNRLSNAVNLFGFTEDRMGPLNEAFVNAETAKLSIPPTADIPIPSDKPEKLELEPFQARTVRAQDVTYASPEGNKVVVEHTVDDKIKNDSMWFSSYDEEDRPAQFDEPQTSQTYGGQHENSIIGEIQKFTASFSETESALKAVGTMSKFASELRKDAARYEYDDMFGQYFGLSKWKKNKAHEIYDNAVETLSPEVFGENTQLRMKATEQLESVDAAYVDATREWTDKKSVAIVNNLKNSITGVGDEFTKQEQQIQGYEKSVQDLWSGLRNFYKSRENLERSDLQKALDKDFVDKQYKRIAEAQELAKQGKAKILDRNDQMFEDTFKNLDQSMHGKTANPVEKINQMISKYVENIDAQLNKLEAANTAKKISTENYNKHKKNFSDLRDYAQNNMRDDLINKHLDSVDKKVSAAELQEARMTASHKRRNISYTMYGRMLAQNESELAARQRFDEVQNIQLKELEANHAGLQEGTAAYDRSKAAIDRLSASIAKNRSEMSKLSGVQGKVTAGFSALDQAAGRFIMRLGRRLLSKAINEIKQFTLQFNEDMTTIQAITLKSDAEMADVRRSTLDTAVSHKTSVADVSAVKKDLYRQGLSDAEVEDRTSSVLKFAKVAGIKTTEATKILTTAIQNGLVSSCEEAMDALVALGDTAATTAKEIGDAMQKCAAAAKVAGVSYTELTPMITVMTSMTQLSGKQVGTALNSIFSRMHKLTTEGYTQDINGKGTGINEVESALGSVGISLRDSNGGWRNTTDVLLDIAKNWESMTDIQKSLVTTSMAGTRQGNMFQTLMEGMSEDGGKKFEEYLNLAENSEGITDKKYETSIKSISASIDELTAAFDRLFASIESSGVIQSFISSITEAITGIQTIIDQFPLIGKAAASIIPILSIVFGMMAFMKTGSLSLGYLAGLGVGIAGFSAMGSIGSTIKPQKTETSHPITTAENVTGRYEQSTLKIKEMKDMVQETEKLGQAFNEYGDKMNELDSNKLESNLQSLISFFPSLTECIGDNSDVLSNWSVVVKNANKEIETLIENEKELLGREIDQVAYDNMGQYVEDNVDVSRDKYLSGVTQSIGPWMTVPGFNQNRISMLDNFGPGWFVGMPVYQMYGHYAHLRLKSWNEFKNSDMYNPNFSYSQNYARFQGSDYYDSSKYHGNIAGFGHDFSPSTILDGAPQQYKDQFRGIELIFATDYFNNLSPEEQQEYITNITGFDVEKNRTAGTYDRDKSMFNLLAYMYDKTDLKMNLSNDYSKYALEGETPGEAFAKRVLGGKITDQKDIDFINKYVSLMDNGGLEYERTAENHRIESSYKAFAPEAIKKYSKSYLLDDATDKEQYLLPAMINAMEEVALEYATDNPELLQNNGDVAWSQLLDPKFFIPIAAEAYQRVRENKSEGDYLSPQDYDYYWTDEETGQTIVAKTREEMMDKMKEATKKRGQFSDKYEREDYDWYNTELLNVKTGGTNTNKGFMTANQTATDVFNNMMQENPVYYKQMQDLMQYAKKSSSFAGFSAEIPSDFNDLAGLLNSNPVLAKAWISAKDGKISWDSFKQILFEQSSGVDHTDHEDNMEILSSIFGPKFYEQLSSGTFDTTSAENVSFYQQAMQDPFLVEQLSSLTGEYDGLDEVIRSLNEGTELTIEQQKLLARVLSTEGVRSANKYKDNVDEIVDVYESIAKGGKQAEDTVQDLNQQMKNRDYARYSLNQFKSGKATDSDYSVLSSFFGIDAEELKAASKDLSSDAAKWMIDSMESELSDSDSLLADTINSGVLSEINDAIETYDVKIPLNMDGTVDASALIANLNAAGANINAAAAAWACTLSLQSDGNKVSVVFNKDGAAKPKGGGGGGNKKSNAEKLMERLKREQSEREHVIKMIQYQETKYENRGEYGNLNAMLAIENEAQLDHRSKLVSQLDQLKAELGKTKIDSDDWYALREEILKTEEAIEEADIAIEENTEKMKENQEAIRQTRVNLESMIESEIQARIQKERDMLSGSVSMQDTILQAIQQRYQDEWDLVKQDIERKKEALEEEKALIDERLNARKEAEDEAEKYAKLAEYKQQLAMVSMDSTRTKDAADLRDKIADLEKELAWDIAEDEAEAQKKRLDDESEAYDDYVTRGDEDLQALLADANNFAEEVKNVMGLSHDDLMKWLSENVKEYANSLDDAKKQMLQTWDDLYKQMYGITDTYWEEINEILSSKDSFLQFMMGSDEYINASETEKASMVYEWSEAYDDYIAALKTGATYEHSDDFLASLGVKQTPTSNSNNKKKSTLDTFLNGIKVGATVLVGGVLGLGGANLQGNNASSSEGGLLSFLKDKEQNPPGYSEGGLVDYTGLAMVHGTPSKPEAFLSSDDRLSIRSMLDAMSFIKYKPSSPNVDTDYSRSASTHIDEVHIEITEAQFNNDEDIEKVADKIGTVFTRKLSEAGVNTLSYAF